MFGIVLAAALTSSAWAQAPIPVTVIDVPSGTTLDVETAAGLVLGVRLIGIHGPIGDECGAESARMRLEELALGRSASLVSDPAATEVSDGRATYYVDRDDGLDIGLQLLRIGAADVEDGDYARRDAYFGAADGAGNDGVGLWTSCDGDFHWARPDDRELRTSAVAFVRRYYRLISRHRYATAWPLLPRRVRRDLGGSFRVWKAGHRGSIGAKVRSANARMSGDKAVVTVALSAGQRDVCNGRVVRMRFRGRWVLAPGGDGWVAVEQHIHKTAGGKVRTTRSECAPPPAPPVSEPPSEPTPPTVDCQGYSPCIPPGPDVDCSGGTGNGPRYTGPVTVTGSDPYGLDSDGDGFGCET